VLRFAWTTEGSFAFTDEGTGPTVLLTHGLPGSVRDFRWLCSALAGRVRSVRVEQPGFGGTPMSTETGTKLAHRARFVLDAADSLGLERFAVIGHSIGGPLAMAVAARAPERVSALGLLASVGLHPHRMARRAKRRPDAARLLTWPPVRRWILPSMREGFRRAGFPSSLGDGDMIQSARVFASLDFSDIREAAFAVRAPTFIAWAEDDPLVESAVGLSLSQVLPTGPRLAFATGGHNIQKTRAVELADALVAWLRLVSRTA